MNLDELDTKILIAEDDLMCNLLFQNYLKSGFKGKILTAYNGIEAVEKCLKHQPELVFMDINMPYKDGINAIKEIRADGFQNPIVVITAFGDRTREQCYEVGADLVVQKPIARDKFNGLVKKYLQTLKISIF